MMNVQFDDLSVQGRGGVPGQDSQKTSHVSYGSATLRYQNLHSVHHYPSKGKLLIV